MMFSYGLLLCALLVGGCTPKRMDIVPPVWRPNAEHTAWIGDTSGATVIITRAGNIRVFKETLEHLHLGPASVEHFDLYLVTPLSKYIVK